jgi:hypothetical protein
MVTGEPHLGFYAGAVLETPDGFPIGIPLAFVGVVLHSPAILRARPTTWGRPGAAEKGFRRSGAETRIVLGARG